MATSKALSVLKGALKACEGLDNVVQKFEDIIEIFADPFDLSWRAFDDIVFRGKQIADNVIKAVDQWEAEEYYDFGVSVGKLIYLILGDSDVPKPQTY